MGRQAPIPAGERARRTFKPVTPRQEGGLLNYDHRCALPGGDLQMRVGRQLGMAFLMGVAVLAPGLARAQSDPDTASYWLAPYILRGWLTPAEPPSGQPFSLSLRGYFPYDCGVIADTTVRATRIEFTMRVGAVACDDTARTWTQEFPLGPLPEGLHTLTIVRTLVRESGAIEVRDATLEIRVGPHPDPPPPTCPLFSHFSTDPPVPHDAAPTMVTLVGCFPYPCGEITQSRILGPTHLEVTMRERGGCTDSISMWSRWFDLGVLPAGTHNLRVTVRDEATPQVSQEFGTWLTVLGDEPPPPPPPPPQPPTSGPLFARLWTVPWPATTTEPTTLVLRGFYPYDCGFIGSVRQAGDFHFELRLGRLPYECVPDTTRAWEYATSLGMVSPGRHTVRVSIQVSGIEDSLAVQDFFGEFDVIDNGPPPLPPEPLPPPSDSLLATRPNPFVDQTRFAVMVSQSTNLDVGILDLQGRVVRTLFRGSMPAGTWEFAWDGRRDDGSKAACGVYFYRSVQAGRAQSRRVVLLPRM